MCCYLERIQPASISTRQSKRTTLAPSEHATTFGLQGLSKQAQQQEVSKFKLNENKWKNALRTVCPRCILRLTGCKEESCYSSAADTYSFAPALQPTTTSAVDQPITPVIPCSLCFGMLQLCSPALVARAPRNQGGFTPPARRNALATPEPQADCTPRTLQQSIMKSGHASNSYNVKIFPPSGYLARERAAEVALRKRFGRLRKHVTLEECVLMTLSAISNELRNGAHQVGAQYQNNDVDRNHSAAADQTGAADQEHHVHRHTTMCSTDIPHPQPSANLQVHINFQHSCADSDAQRFSAVWRCKGAGKARKFQRRKEVGAENSRPEKARRIQDGGGVIGAEKDASGIVSGGDVIDGGKALQEQVCQNSAQGAVCQGEGDASGLQHGVAVLDGAMQRADGGQAVRAGDVDDRGYIPYLDDMAMLMTKLDNNQVDEIIKFDDVASRPVAGVPTVSVAVFSSPTWLGGRYVKRARGYTQTPWTYSPIITPDVTTFKKLAGSVSDVVEGVCSQVSGGKGCKFMSSGREDIDVRMLGKGRPFAVHVINPKHVDKVGTRVTVPDSYYTTNPPHDIEVRDLQYVDDKWLTCLKQGEEVKEKVYRALVWCARPVCEADVQGLCGHERVELDQMTPIRVMHRRPNILRQRYVRDMTCHIHPANPQYFLLSLTSQAGTYIKEFVHSDLGRTVPSVTSLLGVQCECVQLDVLEVKLALPGEDGAGQESGGVGDVGLSDGVQQTANSDKT